ncbi:phosphoribosyltransferase [Tessaracoccus sp.]
MADKSVGTTEFEVLTWAELGEVTDSLARQVADSGFHPDVVIAIARGGLVIAGSITYALDVKLVDAINVEFYVDINETRPDPILLAPMLDSESIADQKILVVDDVADSGRTLALVLKLLRGFGADVRSAVLYHKPRSIVTPDFSWRQTDAWITFPWSANPPVVKGVRRG